MPITDFRKTNKENRRYTCYACELLKRSLDRVNNPAKYEIIDKIKYTKIKSNPELYNKSRIANRSAKKRQRQKFKTLNPEIQKKQSKDYSKKRTQLLLNSYIVRRIKVSMSLSTKTIHNYPDFIKSYRLQILTKRTLKSKKNGKEN
ncbi:MAG: hypothetical protein NT079_04355 [Candidatus Omnitrophica bacterium]|nr:hypothetical protein [Candidatus Omnitrophota bacterium]